MDDELDKQVQGYITNMQSTGTTVNTTVVMVCAEGIVMNKNVIC